MSTGTQLSARNRIKGLFDECSFVEIGSMVHARNTDFNMAEQETPADGVLTGYGTIPVLWAVRLVRCTPRKSCVCMIWP